MRRRNFLENSVAMMGGLCSIPHKTRTDTSSANLAAEVVERCSGSRYKTLNAALDREAMQRGWAKTVNPDYQHAR